MKWRTDIENAPKDTIILGFGLWAGEITPPKNNGHYQICVVEYVGETDHSGYDWGVRGTNYYSSWLKLKAWANIADLPGSLFP